MSKPPKAAEPQPDSSAHQAVEALKAIADIVLNYRQTDKLTMTEVARIADRASGLLRLGDDKATIANTATIEIAKARGLVS